MGPDNLYIIAIVVFILLIVGLVLTVYEFHYYILNDKDYSFAQTKAKAKSKKAASKKVSKKTSKSATKSAAKKKTAK